MSSLVQLNNKGSAHVLTTSTVKTLTLCAGCHKTLKGFYKQGLRCKLCNIYCHKGCQQILGACKPIASPEYKDLLVPDVTISTTSELQLYTDFMAAKIHATKRPPFARAKYSTQDATFHRSLSEFHASYLSLTSASSHSASVINTVLMLRSFEPIVKAVAQGGVSLSDAAAVPHARVADAKTVALIGNCMNRFRVLLVELAAEISQSRKRAERRISATPAAVLSTTVLPAATATTANAAPDVAVNPTISEPVVASQPAAVALATLPVVVASGIPAAPPPPVLEKSKDSGVEKENRDTKQRSGSVAPAPPIAAIDDKKKLVSDQFASLIFVWLHCYSENSV